MTCNKLSQQDIYQVLLWKLSNNFRHRRFASAESPYSSK